MTPLEQSQPQFRWTVAVSGWFTRLVRKQRPAASRLPQKGTGSVLIAAVAFLLVYAGLLVLTDAAAITAARQLPMQLHRFFSFITDFGKSGWVLWPLGAFLVVSGIAINMLTPPARLLLGSLATRAMFLFLAVALPGLFVNAVKGVIGRARPFVGGAADPYLYKIWTWVPAYASFPSGHATAAASIAVAFGVIWPKARAPLWLYAFVIFASRVVVTAHHPSDVFGGAIAGIVGAWLVQRWFAARSLDFAVDPAGKIHPTPGPSWRRIKRVAANAFAQ